MAFVDQPSPPRSPTQPDKERDARGDDYFDGTDDEYLRATAYRDRVKLVSRNHMDQIVKPLRGNRAAARSLIRKTNALLPSSPPYLDMP